MVVHFYNSSSLEVETEGLQCIGGQPELQSETCFRKRKGAKREGDRKKLSKAVHSKLQSQYSNLD